MGALVPIAHLGEVHREAEVIGYVGAGRPLCAWNTHMFVDCMALWPPVKYDKVYSVQL